MISPAVSTIKARSYRAISSATGGRNGPHLPVGIADPERARPVRPLSRSPASIAVFAVPMNNRERSDIAVRRGPAQAGRR